MERANHLKTLIDSIPKGICGVYYFHDKEDKVIYIGKSVDIRSRTQQHFRSNERKEIKLQLLTERISFENTGSELIALLRESELIKQNLPIYNRAQRKVKFFYGFTLSKSADGYLSIQAVRLKEKVNAIATFTTMSEAKKYLYYITDKYQLCQQINGLYQSKSGCFQYAIHQCKGACVCKEEPREYNERVENFLSTLTLPNATYLFELPGRTADEKGIVYIENGHYIGFGFCKKGTRSQEKMIACVEPKHDNRDVRKILFRYLKSIGSNKF